MEIPTPYLLFLGNTKDPLAAKTSMGIAQWRPEHCIGQLSMPGCEIDLGLPELNMMEAVERGAKTLILGLANRGGDIAHEWRPYLKQALKHGLDIGNGLHRKVADFPDIVELADQLGKKIYDVRHPNRQFAVADAKKRTGKRLLAVGTDCSVGKMYTTLAIEQEMKSRGLDVDFRATGQTGIFISGRGVSVDAVTADFISGAIEQLAPANKKDHWDLIEGQGSLFHPSFAGVTLGLIHGSQPDVLVLCHEIGRSHLRGIPHIPLPELGRCIKANLEAARLTNPHVQMKGIAVNSSRLTESEAETYCKRVSDRYGLICVDPLRHGVRRLVDQIIQSER
ncbi:MAG: EBNA-1 nuclear protein [Acidobacteria bacterium]|nr:MAG: EBNA-1 nuclear protein [Acidobacteriota bacterium]PIE90666.1 MAG: EBNA-1 nuclear protein [Acidobacteriota bacterium]